MREPTVVKQPSFEPYACVQCGSQTGRKWFVDIGIALAKLGVYRHEANVYFCNECWYNLVDRININVESFEQTYLMSPYEEVEATVEQNERFAELIGKPESRSEIEPDPPVDSGTTEPTDQGVEGISHEPIGYDPEPVHAASGDELTLFRGFFDKPGS